MFKNIALKKDTVLLVALVLYTFFFSGLFASEALAISRMCGAGDLPDCPEPVSGSTVNGGDGSTGYGYGAPFRTCGAGTAYDCVGSVSPSNSGDGSAGYGQGAASRTCGAGTAYDCAGSDGSSYQLSAPSFLNSAQRDAAHKALDDAFRTLNSLRATSDGAAGYTGGSSSYMQPTQNVSPTGGDGSAADGTSSYAQPVQDIGSTGSAAGASAGSNLTAQDRQEIIDTLRALVQELAKKLDALEKARGG